MSRDDAPLLERIAFGISGGIAGGVGFLPIGILLTRRYPVRVYREGLRGYDELGGGLAATWENMEGIVDSSSYGVRGYEVAISGEDRSLWIPIAIAHDARFVDAARGVLPDDSHPLLGHIAERVRQRM